MQFKPLSTVFLLALTNKACSPDLNITPQGIVGMLHTAHCPVPVEFNCHAYVIARAHAHNGIKCQASQRVQGGLEVERDIQSCVKE